MSEVKPLVAIHCLVYNHAPYLRDCLEGFVMQQTTFPFVAIVHDDASTDGSIAIIREYEEKYPHIFKPIYEKENQWRKGTLTKVMTAAIEATGAKYVAMCEGDDYWIDPRKLQRQVGFLEAHPEYSMSTENGLVINKHGETWKFSNIETRDVSMEELLRKRQFPTASVVLRNKYFIELQNMNFLVFDTFVWTYMSQKGKIHYRDIISSVYRRIDGITERDKIKWAYIVEEFNKNLYKHLEIPRNIIEERNKTQVLDCYVGYKEAKMQKKYRIACDLFCKCFSYDTRFFLKYLYTNSRFIQWIDTIKRSIKKIIKKLLKR